MACGEPAAALAHYESCRRVLAEQLQCRPSPDTARLAERIRSSSLGVEGVEAEPLLPPPTNLPLPVTPFVGRAAELERLAELLADAASSMVTVVGPSGIGKTRLAIQAARACLSNAEQQEFDHGVFFIPSLEAGGDLLAALCDRLGVRPDPTGAVSRELRTLLLDFLQQKRMLLVFDAFEHVQGEAERVVEVVRRELGPEQIAAGLAHGRNLDLEATIRVLLEMEAYHAASG